MPFSRRHMLLASAGAAVPLVLPGKAAAAGGAAPTAIAQSAAGHPVAGLIGNPVSLRSTYAISPYEARGAAYVDGSTVLQLPDGTLHFVPVGSPWDVYRSPGDPDAATAVAADRAWLAGGTVPGGSAGERDMATRALLDLRCLTRPGGAAVAAWYPYWNFVWPRDASWVVAAYAATGHHPEAAAILGFLAKAQHADGTWDARYHAIDHAPVADGRQWQLDGNGWVPWAVWFALASRPAGDPTAEKDFQAWWPMVAAAADHAAASLGADGLPPAGPDYWEARTDQITIGTVAPLRTGLRAAADLAKRASDTARRARYAHAARRLDAAIARVFAPHGYPRSTDPGSGADSAVTFLAPPFAAATPDLAAAVAASAAKLRIASGGVLPGQDWPSDPTLAWTPETAFFALAQTGLGDQSAADGWLQWLSGHRTEIGALPEKVDAAGNPASVAPLGWTGAIVLLALVSKVRSLPVPPVPG